MDVSEIRKNYYQDIHVLADPNRKKRPYKPPELGNAEPPCIFCPENIAEDEVVVYRYPENVNKPWQIISLLNRYSALSPTNELAKGSAEVLIETHKHGDQINNLSVSEIIDVLQAYQDRQNELEKKNKYVLIFKNRGKMAGASRLHSHTQIYALPFVPQTLTSEKHDYHKYLHDNGVCPFCDIIKNEGKQKVRTAWEDDKLYVVAPYASQFEYEAWFIPKRHVLTFTDLTVDELESLARAIKKITGKLEELKLDYNYFLHSTYNDHDFHFHIHLCPRPNNAIWAGLEIGSNTYINPILPEEAAEIYRS